MSRKILSLGTMVSVSLLAAQQPAYAQDANGNTVEEVVVTAQKRSESLQNVPLAITAVTSADLARGNIKDLSGVVSRVPNLNLGQQLGVAKIALRGIGLENLSPGAEGSIAFHVDGVFESRSIAALTSFFDVEQVEVLRGPQGTLYGRNATGGSININTRKPTPYLSSYANVTLGNYGRYATEGAISGPIVSDKVTARLAFQTDNRDGYGHNRFNGREIDDLSNRSLRAKVLFEPTDRFSFELTGDYHRRRDHSGSYHFAGAAGFTAPGVPYQPFGLVYGGSVSDDLRDIDTDVEPGNRVELWGVNGRLAYEFGDGIELRSITAYRKTRYSTVSDLDSTSAPLAVITQMEQARQFSEELQLAGQNERWTWLLGAYYFRERDYGAQIMPFNNFLVGFPAPGTFVQGAFFGGTIETDALAAFGQAGYSLTDDLRLTLGARYSTEKKTDHDLFMFDFLTPYDPALPLDLTRRDDSKRFDSFTPRVALDYQATPDLLLYASWSEGFKSGTYNLGQLQPAVEPEEVRAWEAGLKSSWFGRALRFNLAGFHYEYDNLQVGKIVEQVLALENAAVATIYGLEAELRVQVTPNIEIDANGAWLHARFDEYISADPARPFGDGTIDPDSGAPAFNLAGHSLSQSPDFTFFVGAQYRQPTAIGPFTLRGEAAWRDRTYFTPFNLSYVSQGPNAKFNAFLNWESPDAHWNASLFIKNIEDKTLIGNSYVSSPLLGSPVQAYLEDPRTYGVTVGYQF